MVAWERTREKYESLLLRGLAIQTRVQRKLNRPLHLKPTLAFGTTNSKLPCISVHTISYVIAIISQHRKRLTCCDVVDVSLTLLVLELELKTFCRVLFVVSFCFCRFSSIDAISGLGFGTTVSDSSGICKKSMYRYEFHSNFSFLHAQAQKASTEFINEHYKPALLTLLYFVVYNIY